MKTGGVSTPVVCHLPKVEKRVRFSYPAHDDFRSLTVDEIKEF